MLFPWRNHRKRSSWKIEDAFLGTKRIGETNETYYRQEAGYPLDLQLQLQYVQALVHLQTVYSISLATLTVSPERQRIVSRNASRGTGYALNGLEIRERNDRSGFGIISVAPVNDTIQRANVREPGHLTRLFETPC